MENLFLLVIHAIIYVQSVTQTERNKENEKNRHEKQVS